MGYNLNSVQQLENLANLETLEMPLGIQPMDIRKMVPWPCLYMLVGGLEPSEKY